MTLKKALQQIRPVSSETKKAARLRWDQVAKPLNSLGILEEDLVRIAGAQNSEAVCLDRSGLPSCAQTTALWRKALPRPDRR